MYDPSLSTASVQAEASHFDSTHTDALEPKSNSYVDDYPLGSSAISTNEKSNLAENYDSNWITDSQSQSASDSLSSNQSKFYPSNQDVNEGPHAEYNKRQASRRERKDTTAVDLPHTLTDEEIEGRQYLGVESETHTTAPVPGSLAETLQVGRNNVFQKSHTKNPLEGSSRHAGIMTDSGSLAHVLHSEENLAILASNEVDISGEHSE